MGKFINIFMGAKRANKLPPNKACSGFALQAGKIGSSCTIRKPLTQKLAYFSKNFWVTIAIVLNARAVAKASAANGENLEKNIQPNPTHKLIHQMHEKSPAQKPSGMIVFCFPLS